MLRVYKPFLMWVFPLCFFAYQFILRLWPGLMMPQIMEQFSIDASAFGQLAAFYYYGYAGMQIPMAMLLDRYGARRTIAVFTTICGASMLLFTYTENFYIAVFSRFLIGVGSAAGFLGVSKVVSEWFPKEDYARMIGLSFTFGLMGAIFGGKPISALIDAYPWKTVAIGLAVASLAIGVFVLVFVRSPQTFSVVDTENAFTMKHFKSVLASPLIWVLAVANLLMVGSLEGFADVWGVPYLMTVYNLEKGDAAGIISFVFFGMLIGGPLLAFLSKKLGNYRVISLSGLVMAGIFSVLLMTQSPSIALMALFFVMGILCCYQVIVFAAGSDLSSPHTLGVTIAFLNCINMLGGSFFHTVIGQLMDFFWVPHPVVDGIKLYDASAYTSALTIIPICACIGALMVVGVGRAVAKIGGKR